jgi:hypothetical protein
MKYGKIGDECWTALCTKRSTHVLSTIHHIGDEIGDMKVKTAYCLEHALYFAAWLPYCYPDQYKLVSIKPSADEMFGR